MKTTIDISDALFEQARAQAKARGLSLRALIENGLRIVLNQTLAHQTRPAMRDFSFGEIVDGQSLESLSDPAQWRELANPPSELRDGEVVRMDLQNQGAP